VNYIFLEFSLIVILGETIDKLCSAIWYSVMSILGFLAVLVHWSVSSDIIWVGRHRLLLYF
jgi:hypothetical protein